ncbi:hypothetical protein [Lactococcus kimchii]|uniref:hypothetical protein n=1 Tax=Lactococcus sp. S-13 TaxID=2507158 RepID=UPI001022E16B|nr:hypothetical protein [Lactococcus sp. S-13]RZI48158.1 hypothetical protein EQJ87_01100 [Lactococcus sp. S-13]
MDSFIRTVKRYPFQVWALISNLGIFAWLKANIGNLTHQGEQLLQRNQGMITSLSVFLREHPLYILGFGLVLIGVFHFLRNVGRLIFTFLNLLLILKVLGIF